MKSSGFKLTFPMKIKAANWARTGSSGDLYCFFPDFSEGQISTLALFGNTELQYECSHLLCLAGLNLNQGLPLHFI
jgi:hypothetical protein